MAEKTGPKGWKVTYHGIIVLICVNLVLIHYFFYAIRCTKLANGPN